MIESGPSNKTRVDLLSPLVGTIDSSSSIFEPIQSKETFHESLRRTRMKFRSVSIFLSSSEIDEKQEGHSSRIVAFLLAETIETILVNGSPFGPLSHLVPTRGSTSSTFCLNRREETTGESLLERIEQILQGFCLPFDQRNQQKTRRIFFENEGASFMRTGRERNSPKRSGERPSIH
jgi:hypothetical protein